MSTKGIYTALSGAMAQNKKLETIANNIANVNTPAFKKDKQVFEEYLTVHQKTPDVIQVPKVPASIESFYDLQGGDRSYVNSAGTFTDFTQGYIKQTGNKLDIAIDGPGFFEVLTPRGVRWTRNGSLQLNGNGQLVTKQGYPVLLESAGEGVDYQSRVISLTSPNIDVGESGSVMVNGEEIGKLSVVNVNVKDGLQKEGGNLYRLRENLSPELSKVAQPKVLQGALEGSNVNLIQEMTDMIKTTRVFESAQRAIKAYDSMSDKLVNSVPRVE